MITLGHRQHHNQFSCNQIYLNILKKTSFKLHFILRDKKVVFDMTCLGIISDYEGDREYIGDMYI